MASAVATRWSSQARAGWQAALRWRYVTAWLLGGITALAFAPFEFLPALLGFGGWLQLILAAERPRQAFFLGWCFGFGHFLASLYWIAIAFYTDPERFGPLAMPAVLLLAAYLALYPALAGWLIGQRRWRQPLAAGLALALAWIAAEWLRGHMLWGFPWNLVGYVFSGQPALSQLAALTGVYGLGIVAILAGAWPCTLLSGRGPARWLGPAMTLGLLAVLWAGGSYRLAGANDARVPGIHLRLVQANIAQHHKWDPTRRAEWFERHLALSRDPAGRATHVIWPESATPYQLESDEAARRYIADVAPKGGLVLTGGERFALEQAPPKGWNSLFAIDPAGSIVGRYDKSRLVPFGEFLPWRPVLSRIGLKKVTEGSFDFVPGGGVTTLSLPGLPPFSPLICYEAIFTGGVALQDARPAWLLNVTNDAWFGQSTGPYQHFAMARLRTIEEGLPLVRAANTGISAVVDPWGRIRAELGLGQTGALDSDLPAALAAPTFYARWGLVPILMIAIFSAFAILLIEKPLKN